MAGKTASVIVKLINTAINGIRIDCHIFACEIVLSLSATILKFNFCKEYCDTIEIEIAVRVLTKIESFGLTRNTNCSIVGTRPTMP
jgi:hypothetical protein